MNMGYQYHVSNVFGKFCVLWRPVAVTLIWKLADSIRIDELEVSSETLFDSFSWNMHRFSACCLTILAELWEKYLTNDTNYEVIEYGIGDFIWTEQPFE